MDLLEGKLHYRVWFVGPDGVQATPRTSLAEFAKMLPHGSGLDSDWTVKMRAKGRGFTLYTEYHAMKDGSYTGYFPVRVVLDRRKSDGLLSRKSDGLLTVKSVRCNDRETQGAGEWIADMMHEVCEEA